MSGKRANSEGSIYPVPNGYRAYVWVTTPSGRRQRKYVFGKTREATHEKWLKLHQQAIRGSVATSVPKLGAYLGDWLRDIVEPNLAPATAANYEMFIRLYINPHLGERRMDRITIREVQTWLNVLRVTCTCCAQDKDAKRPPKKQRCCAKGECCEHRPSDWTVHQAWTILCSALSNAVRDEMVSRNVAALVKVPVPRTRKPRRWSVDEARQSGRPVIRTTRRTR
jgi:Phage integrase, N-terminal SAM-like domain